MQQVWGVEIQYFSKTVDTRGAWNPTDPVFQQHTREACDHTDPVF